MRKKKIVQKQTRNDNYTSFPLQGNSEFNKCTLRQKKFIFNIFKKPITKWSNAKCYSDASSREEPTPSDQVEACRLLKKPRILALVGLLKESYSKSLHVSTERLLEEESYIAFSDLGEFFDKDGELKVSPKKLPPAARRAISSWKKIPTMYGHRYEVTLWNKGDALRRLESITGIEGQKKINVRGAIEHTHSNQTHNVDLTTLTIKELFVLEDIAKRVTQKIEED